MRGLLLVLFAAGAAAQSQNGEFKAVGEKVLEQRLRLAHPKNPERYRRLKALLAECGCTRDLLTEQRVPGSKQPNMICRLAGTGKSPRRIVVGAHFDSVGGDGVIDNWSGAVLLPTLFEGSSRAPRRHMLEFVAFAAEEEGLLGSRAYLKAVPKAERGEIAAVVILDCLGLSPVKCWVNGSDKELVLRAARVAAAMNFDLRGVNVERVGTTDSQPFKDSRIPVLSLHSVTRDTLPVINNSGDVWKAVSWSDYYHAYRFISALLSYLDQNLP